MIDYPFDDDPPLRREKPCGVLKNAQWCQTTAAYRSEWRARCERMTVDGKQRFLRNLAITLGSRICGLSQRELASIFDLPHSRIAAILKEMGSFADAGFHDRSDR